MPAPVSREDYLAEAEHFDRMAEAMVWNETACCALRKRAAEARAKARAAPANTGTQHL
jgi:hypothetical protein